MILNYDEYITHEGNYGKNSSSSKLDKVFFQKRGYCPFCQISIDVVHNKGNLDISSLPGGAIHLSETVWECDNCGWWERFHQSYIDAEESWDMKDWENKVNSAILKKFDVDSKEVPIDILSDYIFKNPEKIYGIHHNKMEELVGSVFKEHYNCEVHHVGMSGDGGKDLILIESDKSIVVQVKRRQSRHKTETASCVRDLIGATLLNGSRDCIFVSTADHFSKQSIKHKEDALAMKIIDSFELFDIDKFMSVLNLYTSEREKLWRKLVEIR
ncbi:hypothetical protein COJ86_03850 [Bacillus cereus]|nr:hypothetical protein COJ86_03850 [Bacillus cereus]